MTIAIESVGGGTFTGSGAGPNSSVCGGGLSTSGSDRLAVIICTTARANSSPDFNFPTDITGTALTWTHEVHEEVSFTDTPGGGSFPVGSFSIDMFTAPAPTALTNMTWNSTMSGDGFVNDGVVYQFAISGLNPSAPLDGSGSLPMEASNTTGSSSAPALTGFVTDDTDDLLMTIAFNHNSSSDTAPSALSGWTLMNGSAVHSDAGAGATHHYLGIQTKLQASPGTISITLPYSDDFWGIVGLAFTAGSAPVISPWSFGTVVN